MRPFAARTEALQNVCFGKVVLVGFASVVSVFLGRGLTVAGLRQA